MKRIRMAIVIGLAATAICIPSAELTDAAKKDLDQLQGEWAMVSGTADGFDIPEEMAKGARRVCKGDEVTVTVGGNVTMKAKITLDPSKKPKAIDYEVTGGANRGKKQLGIYELEGDMLKSCFAAPGAERPTEFSSKSGSRHTASVWKRLKVADAKPESK